MKIKDVKEIVERRWINHLYGARQRCNNSKHHAFKYYGGKGIKCLLTKEDIEKLWHRDNANALKIPSINRKDSNKDYTFENCEFIEREVNSKEGLSRSYNWDIPRKKEHSERLKDYHTKHLHPNRVAVLVLDSFGCIVGRFKSQSEASKELHITQSSISETLSGKRKHSKGFKFEILKKGKVK